MYPTQVDRLIS